MATAGEGRGGAGEGREEAGIGVAIEVAHFKSGVANTWANAWCASRDRGQVIARSSGSCT